MHTRPLSTLLATAILLAACADDATAPAPPPETSASAVLAPEGWRTPAPVETGYVLGRDGKPVAVTFEIREGRAIREGDIDLGPAGAMPRTPDAAVHAPAALSLGIVTSNAAATWPGGRVPYVIDPFLPSPSRVTGAIAQIEAATGVIDFVPRTNETAYVYVIPSTGCSSAIGRTGSVQYVRLTSGCTTGSAVHELLHALGVIHEHTRCNRDAYVRVDPANIQVGQAHNFSKVCTGELMVDTYDEGSIMHYPPGAFSANGLPTIASLRGLEWMMGQRVAMSAADVRTVVEMYGG